MRSYSKIIAAVFFLIWAGSAVAHPGHEVEGFISGFSHPLSGIDHMLSMLVIGLLAGQRGGKSLVLMPLVSLVALIAATASAASELFIPFTETGIVLTLIVFGLVVALRTNLPQWSVYSLIALFSICNGYAHGIEMPFNAKGLEYGFGLMAGSAVLLAAGMVVAHLRGRDKIVSGFGAIIAFIGLGLLIT